VSEELERCYLAALRILNYRFNSAAELRRKLRSKKFDDATIAETLARLTQEKWLDDARFAGALVRSRQNRKLGPRRIARELHAAGVDREAARQAMQENADPEREREDLKALYEKKLRMMVRRHGQEYAASPEGRKKLAVYLLNQGYDAALVQSILKETPVVDD
jgi:regulatory protein